MILSEVAKRGVEMPLLKVGICMTKSKKLKLNLPSCILDLCDKNGIEVVDIDMDGNLEDQGPFDIILHKILEWCNEDKKKGSEYFERFKDYLKSHKNTILIDPISTCLKLTNRIETLQAARNCEFTMHGKRVYVPNFLFLDGKESGDPQLSLPLLESNSITFPVIVKHQMGACFGKQVHDMCIVFCKENLSDIKPPCIVQQFDSHNGIMVKIYTIGEKVYLFKRPSIKNLKAGPFSTIFFNSSAISKHGKPSPLHDSDASCILSTEAEEQPLLEESVLERLLQKLHSEFEFNLLGIDIIVCCNTGNYGIVDINYFPGYDGAKSHVPQDLVNLFMKTANS